MSVKVRVVDDEDFRRLRSSLLYNVAGSMVMAHVINFQ